MRFGKCLALVLTLLLAGCSLPESGGAESEQVNEPMPIGRIQGSESTSPYLHQRVEVQGVVTGNFVAGLDGFFLQDAIGEDDGDAATSNGLFVAWPRGSTPKVRRGERVRVSGTVVEMDAGGDSQTAIQASAVEVLGRGAAAATELDEPPERPEDWERLEGMWLRIIVPLTVSGNDGLLRYGELATSFGPRLFTPTERHAPGSGTRAVEEDNARRRLVLDDNRSGEYPKNLWYLPEPLSDSAPLRAGSLVHGAEGILQHAWGWRLQLTEALERVEQASRPPPPELPEGLRVASFNLLNWFNGDGKGHGFPTERGAVNLAEMNRQRDKLVAAILGIQPDIAALMEVENDGFGRSSSLAQLVTALNASWPEAGYRLVDAKNGPGLDVMRVAMIYREGRVTPVGAAATISEGPFAQHHRVPLAQAFELHKDGDRLVVVANHFKSKGCGEAEAANADQGDGQSCWNAARREAAQALDAWLRTEPAGRADLGTVILGDLNSYGREDPVRALVDAGWKDAFEGSRDARPYSFNYRGYSGRLDHALLTSVLKSRLRAAVEWHINADESEAFDYQIRNRDKRWYRPDPYRSSDHDPLVLVFDLEE